MRALLFFGSLLTTALLFAPGDATIASHVTAHWDFESAESVDSWGVFLGDLRWSPGRGVDGSAAAALTVESNPFGTVRVVHPMSLVSGASYRLSGQFVSSDGEIDLAELAFSFQYADGGRHDLAYARQLSLPGAWSFTFPAPCDAVAGELILVVQGVLGASAYIDELSFELVDLPSTPCPVPARPPDPEPAPPPLDQPPPVDAPAVEVPIADEQPASPTPLLTNYGFETAEGGVLARWRSFGGVLTQTAKPVHSGLFAAAFSSASESTKWVYQTVRVTPEAWYRFDGYVYLNNPRAEAALLRISWYTSNDGSGRAVATVDSKSQLDEPAARFRYLTTGPVQAPPGVHSARLRILLRPRSAASTVIYIDDISFRSSAPGSGTAVSRGPRSSGGGLTSDAASSPTLGHPTKAFPLTPFATPVIVRSSQLRVAKSLSSDGSVASWAWAALAGGVVLAVCAAGGGARWWRAREP